MFSLAECVPRPLHFYPANPKKALFWSFFKLVLIDFLGNPRLLSISSCTKLIVYIIGTHWKAHWATYFSCPKPPSACRGSFWTAEKSQSHWFGWLSSSFGTSIGPRTDPWDLWNTLETPQDKSETTSKHPLIGPKMAKIDPPNIPPYTPNKFFRGVQTSMNMGEVHLKP